MFKFQKTYEYDWPVQVRMPDPDHAGKIKPQSFTAKFRTVDPEAFLADGDAPAADDLLEVLAGWEGITDEDGDALPFSEENARELIKIVPVQVALTKAWLDSMTGQAVAKRKRGN